MVASNRIWGVFCFFGLVQNSWWQKWNMLVHITESLEYSGFRHRWIQGFKWWCQGSVFLFHLLPLYGGITAYIGLRMFVSEEEREVFFFSIYISNSTQKLWLLSLTLLGLLLRQVSVKKEIGTINGQLWYQGTIVALRWRVLPELHGLWHGLLYKRKLCWDGNIFIVSGIKLLPSSI